MKEGKYQESIQSSTSPAPGQYSQYATSNSMHGTTDPFVNLAYSGNPPLNENLDFYILRNLTNIQWDWNLKKKTHIILPFLFFLDFMTSANTCVDNYDINFIGRQGKLTI